MILNNPVYISVLTFIVSVMLFFLLGKFILKHIEVKLKNLLTYVIIALTVVIVIFGTFLYTPNFISNCILTAIVGAMAGITIVIVTTKKA